MNDAFLDLLERLKSVVHMATSVDGAPEWILIGAALLVWLGVHRASRASAKTDVLSPVLALLSLVIVWHWLFLHRETVLLKVAAPIMLGVIAQRMALRWLLTVFQVSAHIESWHRQLRWIIWGIVALEVLGLSDSVLDLADSLSLPMGGHSVSLLKMIQGGLIVIVALLCALWFSRTLERRIMAVTAVDASFRVALTKLTQGGLIAIAVILTLPLIGVDTTFLSVIGGALGVGLGFGLQKIASNYVSGFIILLDRSVRLNDLISVDGRKGVVTQMEARYTVLRAVDGTEAVVPNETFVTGSVINHTLHDRKGSLAVTVWLTHAADLRAVTALSLPIPVNHSGVMESPAPQLQVLTVNDIGIEVQLSWWVFDLAQSDAALRSDILLAWVEALKADGIALARRPVMLGP